MSRPYLLGLFGLLAFSLTVRVLWLDASGRQLMFDEGYYVAAAHNILRLEPLANDPYPYAHEGVDPNIEHPIGAKRLIAASVRAFGDNGYGWRLPSAIFGTLAILFVFLLARRLTGNDAIALAAATLTALDPMMLVHSRVAMLDMFVVALLVAGLYAYVAGRPIVAGLLIAGATLCKLTGIAGVVVLGVFELGRMWRDRAETQRWSTARLRLLVWAVASVIIFVPALMFVLNIGASIFANPFDNLFYVYTHQAATYSFRPPGPIPQSLPWEWLLNRTEITYFNQGALHLRGLYNPLLIFAAVPVAMWALRDVFTKRSDAALMVFAMIAGCYLPLVAASLGTPRQTYIYYFLPTLPALAIGVSALGSSLPIPRFVRVAYLIAAAAAFAYYFPFRGLP